MDNDYIKGLDEEELEAFLNGVRVGYDALETLLCMIQRSKIDSQRVITVIGFALGSEELMRGKTIREVALQAGVTPQSIISQIDSIKRQLGNMTFDD